MSKPHEFILTFKEPFKWDGKEHTEIHFDFDKLKGRDMDEIEREIAQTDGAAVLVPSLSGPFLMSMAARAAGIGRDMIAAMSISHAVQIRNAARAFLLATQD